MGDRLYDRLADLPLAVEGYDLRRHEMDTSSGFTRVSTVVELHGDGATGRGEDVTYETEDQETLQAAHDFEFAGEYALDGFSALLGETSLWPEPPERETSRHYRRWAFESAALDLALRQAGETLASALARRYDPVRFVVSTSLGDPPTADRVRDWLDIDPSLQFKLDPRGEWDRDLMEALAETGAVRVLDLKGFYEGTEVDTEADPALYRAVAETFPDAVIEDPDLTGETTAAFEAADPDFRSRVAWDYPITGVESVRDLPFEPAWLNVKPSRFGTVASLLDTLEYCTERDVRLYGGGQFELSVGREHLHALASLFYPGAPNDVAPSAYNTPEPQSGLPSSPLAPPADPRGLRWG